MTPMSLKNSILLLVVVTLCATFSMRMFQGLDEMMGDQYWVVDTAQGDHGWYMMGVLPHLQKMAKSDVLAINTDADPENNLII